MPLFRPYPVYFIGVFLIEFRDLGFLLYTHLFEIDKISPEAQSSPVSICVRTFLFGPMYGTPLSVFQFLLK